MAPPDSEVHGVGHATSTPPPIPWHRGATIGICYNVPTEGWRAREGLTLLSTMATSSTFITVEARVGLNATEGNSYPRGKCTLSSNQ